MSLKLARPRRNHGSSSQTHGAWAIAELHDFHEVSRPKALLDNISSIPTNGPDTSIAKYRILLTFTSYVFLSYRRQQLLQTQQ
jgi:hypothetical protein